jgi:hypothetical protein
MKETPVPANVVGKPTDLHATHTFSSASDAVTAFNLGAKNLLDPSGWHKLAGWASAHFTLVAPDGWPVERPAMEGDYLKIDVPGPGPAAGDGYDWVKVEWLEEDRDPSAGIERIGIQLRPCPEPGAKRSDTAHFFRDSATSTIIIERSGDRVAVLYHGRNEVPNNATDHTLDNIRNTVIATGAMVSFSEAQWGALIKGLLGKDKG